MPQNDNGLSSNKYFPNIRLCQILLISGITIYLISIFLLNNQQNLSSTLDLKCSYSQPNSTHHPTNVSHLMFGLLGSAKTWKHRKTYVEAWWRPNVTRGYVYLDQDPAPESLPWSQFSPPYRICKDMSNVVVKSRDIVPLMIRMNMAILEIFREDHEDMRWIIMGDDDTMFFVDNLVDVLGRYDHNDYIYIGDHSESISSDYFFSFDMGFGGGGIVLSFPLAKAFVETFEWCLATNPGLRNSADFITMACVEDLGVSLTVNKGIHQTDLIGDISGFLSSHPLTPILSLHHFDVVHPLYPSKDRFESAKHLMRAANADQLRLVQQKICYNRQVNWTFSVSWGYSAHIYESIIPRSMLSKPLETFRPWFKPPRHPYFIFSTRPLSGDPCLAPHWFFLDKVDKKMEGNEVVTSYVRARPRGIAACEFSGNISAEHIGSIRVYSPATKPVEIGRSECCDIIGDIQDTYTKEVKIKIRTCMDNEIIG